MALAEIHTHLMEKVLISSHYRLSDASAQMTFEEVARGKAVTKSQLNSDDGTFVLQKERLTK